MKINLVFTEKEATMMASICRKYDFMNRINHEKLSKKYSEGNCAGSFEYSGIGAKGAEIKFESHEKLLLAAGRIYIKYADTVNGILAGVKSVIMSCKSLFRNFESDYKKELNQAFEEIRIEDDMKKEAKKAEEKIRKEIREKAEADFKRTFGKIRKLDKDNDDDELY